ncbi:G-type lectin S-receptor-like serine/threonine-protein kinase At1g11330 isoform X2 [Silene latifolia]
MVVHFMDDGNLILLSNGSGNAIWQSFNHPTDVFLPDMTFSINSTVKEIQALFRSWKSPVDPAGGNFTVGIDTRTPPQVFLWDNDRPYWRNGPWNGNIYVGTKSVLSITTNNPGVVDFEFTLADVSAHLLQFVHFVVNYNGSLVQRDWNSSSGKWETVWYSQQNECDFYGKCGPFGSCNATNSPICGCLRGFVPKNSTEWNKRNWTGGCVRKTLLQCDTVGEQTDRFLNLTNVKVPDNAQWVSAASEDECSSQCTGDCSCLAFGYYPSIGCLTWNDSLIDIEEYSDDRGLALSVRLASSDLGVSTQQQKHHSSLSWRSGRWIVIAVVLVVVSITVILKIKWLRRNYGTRITQLAKIMLKGDKTNIQIGDLPMFELGKMATATNDFQESNKLGRGGFGTVYKGKLEDGEEVAVKRLSKLSGQGLEEFMTEVLVISKLQHRNLVRLLGCCVKGEEKLLVYEYMPNKSLDALLFDRLYQELLGWKTRFNIIQGISRGLLYLHRDSRLKIIHRDLKASNILLDDKLNPKISDFGMARIFGGSEDQADTNRVVGTYGYMSPEYAMEGRFSEKSDIYSFGVLLLEIVSGRRNNSFRNEESLSLLAHAWKLWNEDDILSLIDPVVLESGFQDEILRCIQVALLCVQELPEDRPNISMVISMIDSEVSNLPHPTQPGFTQRRYTQNQSENVTSSVNRVSLSYITGR